MSASGTLRPAEQGFVFSIRSFGIRGLKKPVWFSVSDASPALQVTRSYLTCTILEKKHYWAFMPGLILLRLDRWIDLAAMLEQKAG